MTHIGVALLSEAASARKTEVGSAKFGCSRKFAACFTALHQFRRKGLGTGEHDSLPIFCRMAMT